VSIKCTADVSAETHNIYQLVRAVVNYKCPNCGKSMDVDETMSAAGMGDGVRAECSGCGYMAQFES